MKNIISTKGLTADLVNKYSILNEAIYFSLNELQNYLVFVVALHLQIIEVIHGSQKEYQKKVLHLHLQQTKVQIQNSFILMMNVIQKLNEYIQKDTL